MFLSPSFGFTFVSHSVSLFVCFLGGDFGGFPSISLGAGSGGKWMGGGGVGGVGGEVTVPPLCVTSPR